jgi:murein DD-endopeptidase MepM/ murein hydrolase activator NlpD
MQKNHSLKIMRIQKSLILLIFIGLCVGCTSNAPSPTPTATLLPTHTSSPQPTVTSTPLPTLTPTREFKLCSPIAGFQTAELQQFITQPFIPPTPRLDNGHHGMDIAFFAEGQRPPILGLPIQSILPGKVAAVLNNNGPYGNLIIVETPLDNIPFNFQDAIPVPTTAPTVTSDARLLCPPEGNLPTYDTSGKRSLYVLYAHLLENPTLKVGDPVQICQILGKVGNTGWSSDPHLHIETRVGPTNAVFGEIVHRVPATLEQAHNYCVWRISNLFELMDPAIVLFGNPK